MKTLFTLLIMFVTVFCSAQDSQYVGLDSIPISGPISNPQSSLDRDTFCIEGEDTYIVPLRAFAHYPNAPIIAMNVMTKRNTFWWAETPSLKKWNYLKTGTIMGIGILQGVAQGFNEALYSYPDKVIANNPFISRNRQYFDPRISHTNKYKNGDINQGEAYFQSEDLLVWTTDYYHGNRGFQYAGEATKLVLNFTMGSNPNWKEFGINFILGTIARTLTAHVIIEHYKNKP